MRVFANHVAGVWMVLQLCLSASAQQNPDGQLPVTTLDRPYLFLIRDAVVWDDLELDDKQRSALAGLNDELDRDLLAMRNKSPQFVNETMMRARSMAEAKLAQVLTPSQLKRLSQIEWWTLGTRALVSSRLSDALEMSPAQVSEIGEILAKTRSEIAELSKKLQAGESREAIEKQVVKVRTEGQRKVVAVLTQRQQQLWVSLLGKRIDLAKLGRVKFKAPELQSAANDWVNSPPLSLEQMKGKVVALHFYAFA